MPGTDGIYDIIPAPGEVADEGTFLNKSTLLKDATAALFGLGTDAVPDDALAYLGQYFGTMHIWKKWSASELLELVPVSSIPFICDNISYGTNVSVDVFGNATLTGTTGTQTAYTIGSADYSTQIQSLIAGKYVVATNSATGRDIAFYAPSDCTIAKSANLVYLATNCSAVSVNTQGETEYVFSENENAYPKNGELNGYQYLYLGVGKNLLLDSYSVGAKIITGTYIGTGVSGSEYPIGLTFDRLPDELIVRAANHIDGDNTYNKHRPNAFRWYPDITTYASAVNANYQATTYFSYEVTDENATVTWYAVGSTTNSAQVYAHCNSGGTTYYYMAIFRNGR